MKIVQATTGKAFIQQRMRGQKDTYNVTACQRDISRFPHSLSRTTIFSRNNNRHFFLEQKISILNLISKGSCDTEVLSSHGKATF